MTRIFGRLGLVIVAMGLFVAALSGSDAFARGSSGRGSSDGESLERQQQYNPVFIQPFEYANPARYRVGHPIEGYYERQWLAGSRGYVRVRPYDYE